ncbi:MAG: hypothetical protein KDF59_12305 [Nitrosomonas sp.]|nr:hypothetical protein [Nitrosomonas sp.]
MRQFFFFCIASLIIFFSAQSVNADETFRDRFRISSFGTLGITHAGKDQFGYRNELTHKGQFNQFSIFPDSVFGLQVNAHILPNLNATVQVIAEKQVKQNFNNIVDWAYLTYQPSSNITLRGGRMGIDLFMLSEYRNLGFAYLWARPITEFYTPVSLSHFEGIDLKYSNNIDLGYFEFKVYGGQTGSDIRVNRGDFSVRMRPIFGAVASLETNHWKARATFAATHIDETRSTQLRQLLTTLDETPAFLWPKASGFSDLINGEGNQAYYYSLGFSYDKNNWLAQSEFAITDSSWPSVALTNGYLSLGRRIGPVTFYTVGSYAKSLNDPKTISPRSSQPEVNALQDITENSFNAVLVNQNSFSLGMRWDFHTNMALKAQWDHTWVRKNGGGLLILREPLVRDIELNIFSLNLSFVY